jgi:5-(carboxyamino)imidazole ribonucleotide mutase
MVAAITSLPVIGVPIKTATLQGLDSLLSIVQMPTGVPVATVAINGAKNAGILAAQIISVKYPEVRERIKQYKHTLQDQVCDKATQLAQLGYEQFLARSV